MKNLNRILSFLIALLLFASCQKDLDIPGNVAPTFDGQKGLVELSPEMEALIDVTTTDETVAFDPCHEPSLSASNNVGVPTGGAAGPSAPAGAPGAPGAPGATGGSTTGGAAGAPGATDYDSSSDGGSTGSDGPDYVITGGTAQDLVAGVLTAGETSDLKEWDSWKSLSSEFDEYQDHWGLYPNNRVSINMRDSEGSPYIDLPVFLLNEDDEAIWTSRTDNSGSAELWINPETGIAESVKLAAVIEDEVWVYGFNTYENGGTNQYTISGIAPAAKSAEITIAFDATGSMGDELEYIKVETTDIFDRVVSDNPSIDFKFASVFYRDYGDAYVETAQAMTSSGSEVIDFINQQAASGGGDFPEAVHRALQATVVDMDYAAPARTRIMFLILDAPPHDDQCTTERIQLLVREAARKGIKIIPITASGINKSTEYLMRFCAQLTNGTYSYITDHSGIGNEHLEPSVDAIEVEFLNDLMVRLVNQYLE